MKSREEFSLESLRAGIHRCLDDNRSPFIRKSSLEIFGRHHWKEVLSSLKQWESEGILKIVCEEVEAADPDETCVEMISYINRDSPITGFLNYRHTETPRRTK